MSERGDREPISASLGTFDPRFIARDRELRLLQEHARWGSGPIIITGAAGSGKTSLLRNFLSTREVSTPPPLLLTAKGQELPLVQIKQEMHRLWQREEVPKVVALDDAEVVLSSGKAEDIRAAVFNYKRVRSLIFSARRVAAIDQMNVPIIDLEAFDETQSIQLLDALIGSLKLNFDKTRVSELAQGNPRLLHLLARNLMAIDPASGQRLLNGQLYDISKDFLVPHSQLIDAIKPKLLMTSVSLAERLKSNPSAIHQLTPRQFEELLADLMEDMGYEVELTPATRDGGKDIMAYLPTPHGRLLCLVEAKKYRPDRPVGVSLVRELFGTLVDANATNAMLVTTSLFSSDARAFQARHEYKLALRDYGNVVDWIYRYRRS